MSARECCLRFIVGNDAPALVAMCASNTPNCDCVFLVSHTGTARLIAHRLLYPPPAMRARKKLYREHTSVVPRCVPVDMKRNRHGDRAVSVVVGTERVLVSGKWRTIEVRACLVTWRPHPEQITSARRGYEDWWQALDWVRDRLLMCRVLREVGVTEVMPKMKPWGTK